MEDNTVQSVKSTCDPLFDKTLKKDERNKKEDTGDVLTIKIHYIVVGILAFFGILIVMQMILPFPWGLVGGFVIAVMVLVTFIKKATRYSSKPLPPTKPDDTQFWVCPHCGKDTEAYFGKQYCRSCNVYL